MGPCKEPGLKTVVLYDELGNPIGTATNPLEVSGSLTVEPGVATDSTAKTDPFDSVLPHSHTVTPADDYELEYITLHFLGLTANASITVLIFYEFTAGASWETMVVEETFTADAAGEAHFYKCFSDFRKTGDATRVEATTDSVAVTGEVSSVIAHSL